MSPKTQKTKTRKLHWKAAVLGWHLKEGSKTLCRVWEANGKWWGQFITSEPVQMLGPFENHGAVGFALMDLCQRTTPDQEVVLK